MTDKDIVVFLMPDGTKVSNDPRFDMESAREDVQAATEYRGDEGVSAEEFTAQTQVQQMANLNSGQPGVGENAAPDPQELIGNTGTPAMQRQKEDLAEAQAAGADLTNTSVNDADPVDSNAAVQEVRDAQAEAAEALRKASEKLGDEGEGDPDEPYSKWSVAQLKFEVSKRNADRDEASQINISGAKKKSDLAAALDADNEGTGSSTPA
jgi:hypothetical protein